MTVFTSLLSVHIGVGLFAVAVGLLPIFTRKGSRLHRLSGRVFAGSMIVLLICAWAMTALQPDPYFLGLSATASLTLFSGLRVLGRKRPDLNPGDRARPLDWIVTLAAAGIGLLTTWMAIKGYGDTPPQILIALAYGALSMSGWDLWRFSRPLDWPFSPRLWTFEHLWKMLGAYGAVLSAFSGNFLTFLPPPWSALWPTVLFQSLSVIWIAVLLVRSRARPAAA
ncbi:hypothetical protein [Brevundimonas sp.]|uniref:hypothetical protein n=1 Tax=Brevundimonas sp. TaxID=1871086 RepID=UPI0026085713|nr:hypothetical protein [Brevundimonas sp.]